MFSGNIVQILSSSQQIQLIQLMSEVSGKCRFRKFAQHIDPCYRLREREFYHEKTM
jgi:hypothetical protein